MLLHGQLVFHLADGYIHMDSFGNWFTWIRTPWKSGHALIRIQGPRSYSTLYCCKLRLLWFRNACVWARILSSICGAVCRIRISALLSIMLSVKRFSQKCAKWQTAVEHQLSSYFLSTSVRHIKLLHQQFRRVFVTDHLWKFMQTCVYSDHLYFRLMCQAQHENGSTNQN